MKEALAKFFLLVFSWVAFSNLTAKVVFAEPQKDSEVVFKAGKTHQVWIWQESQDSLWQLAKKYYGDGWKWKKIYLANRDSILDPKVIFPKQKIWVPLLEENKAQR